MHRPQCISRFSCGRKIPHTGVSECISSSRDNQAGTAHSRPGRDNNPPDIHQPANLRGIAVATARRQYSALIFCHRSIPVRCDSAVDTVYLYELLQVAFLRKHSENGIPDDLYHHVHDIRYHTRKAHFRY